MWYHKEKVAGKTLKEAHLKFSEVRAVPTNLYGSKTLTVKKHDLSEIQAYPMIMFEGMLKATIERDVLKMRTYD